MIKKMPSLIGPALSASFREAIVNQPQIKHLIFEIKNKDFNGFELREKLLEIYNALSQPSWHMKELVISTILHEIEDAGISDDDWKEMTQEPLDLY